MLKFFRKIASYFCWSDSVSESRKYGWDGKCRRCGCWHHEDHAGLFEKATTNYWHYKCVCGHLNSYHLHGPFPIADDAGGLEELRREGKGINTNGSAD